MNFTTRTKITALFASIVSILIVFLNMIIFESANKEWQSKKSEYMKNTMDSMLSIDEAKKMFVDLEVVDASGTTVYSQGVFTTGMKHDSIGSWIFEDPFITIANGRAYYWWIESKADGYTYKTVDDVTDIIFARDMIIERSLWLSLVGFMLIVFIGYFFSGYILRPIQNMNDATRRFSLSQKGEDQHVGIYGNIKDEVVILARSLEELFVRVNKEAERLEQFSDDIAHEIKNKLFEVMSSLDLAANPEHTEYGIAKAKRVLKQLSSVVDALLFFARNDVKNPEEKNIAELIEFMSYQDDPRIKIIKKSNLTLPIYPELFITALGNIIGNAQKFTKDDGEIKVIISKDSIEISDNGIGISKENLPYIFDRLYKVDRARTKGTWHGLGLSISRKIIEELHKMHISVVSTPSIWTTFTITWPEVSQ